jgi:hypothetical protein
LKRSEIGREREIAAGGDSGGESRRFASHLFFGHGQRASGSRSRVRPGGSPQNSRAGLTDVGASFWHRQSSEESFLGTSATRKRKEKKC